MVFVRLKTDYSSIFECFLRTEDIVAVTKEIMNEYQGRYQTSYLSLYGFIEDLRHKGKLKSFKQSKIDAGIKEYDRRGRIRYPDHSPDKKWVKVALVVEAEYIVSTNGHLLELPPNRCRNNRMILVKEPIDYLMIRCPNASQNK